MLLSASLCDNNQMLCCADYSVEIIASCGLYYKCFDKSGCFAYLLFNAAIDSFRAAIFSSESLCFLRSSATTASGA